MKTYVSPFQLFFLTFLYVFSGITLAGADSITALLLPLGIAVLWAFVGYGGALQKRETFRDFLSAYLPKKETGIPLAFFLTVTGAELVYVLLDVGMFFRMGSDFIPFPLILAILLGIASLVCRGGMTLLGRFSELILILLVPLVSLHLLGGFEMPNLVGTASVTRLLFAVMPAPIFFLLSMTTVSGDDGTSDAFRITAKKPKNRAGYLTLTVIGGAGLAVLMRLFLIVFSFGESELLLYFLEYGAHTAKLSILISLLVQGLAGTKRNHMAYYVMFSSIAVILTAAIMGGAVFSPFLWMILLICLSFTVSAMLGIFSFFH